MRRLPALRRRTNPLLHIGDSTFASCVPVCVQAGAEHRGKGVCGT